MSRLSVFLFLFLLPVAAAMAQDRMEAHVAVLCHAPPMDADALDRMRRSPDFMAVLDGLAVACPEVAMLFSQFTIGEVGHSADDMPERHPPDFLCHVGPERIFGQVASIPSF